MRIHTSLSAEEFGNIFQDCITRGLISRGTRLEMTEHASKSRPRAFEVTLISRDQPTPYEKRRRVNAYGVEYGTRDEFGGTWQEHGFFFEALYAADSRLDIYRIYADWSDFADRTIGIFDDLAPLTRATAADLEVGDRITGWGRSGSGIGEVAGITGSGKRREVSIALYGGLNGYRYTDKVVMRADRPVLLAR